MDGRRRVVRSEVAAPLRQCPMFRRLLAGVPLVFRWCSDQRGDFRPLGQHRCFAVPVQCSDRREYN
jgi:hypothetical protein